MALPQVYAAVSPLEFYPDKLTVNLQYSVSLGFRDLDKGFRSNGFRLRNGQWTYDLNLNGQLGYGRRGFTARIHRPRFGAPLSCYIDINPLRAMNEHLGSAPYEWSTIPHSNNWLPASFIGRDNRQVWRLCHEYVAAARTIISDIISDIQIQAKAPHLPRPTFMHASVHTVESTIDFYASNPRQLVVDFMPAFSALLKENEQRQYRPTQVISPEPGLMIHGFVNDATRIKMYCRTNRRVRFEVQFRPDTFEHFNIDRAISGEEQRFEALFDRCAVETHRLFQTIRARTALSLNINAARTPIDLIVALASATRRPEIMRELLDCLLRTGSVRNSLYDHKLVATLRKRGLLEFSLAHGFSCISSQYGYAAALLANAQEDYFTRELRRPFGRLNQAVRRVRRNRRASPYRCH